jgi:poly(3-hydroxyoctanoate) depolymerase
VRTPFLQQPRATYAADTAANVGAGRLMGLGATLGCGADDMNTSQPTKILFLPGAGGSPGFWKPVASAMTHPASRHFLGWPGIGSVPARPDVCGMQDLVRIVEEELDQPTALVAQSMGGVVAIQAAVRQPARVTHLVLTATSAGVKMSDLQAEDWRGSYVGANPHAPRWFVDFGDDMSALFTHIFAPVLLIWGDSDPISPVGVAHRLQRLLPGSALHVLAGGDHELALKKPSSVALLIDEHLKRGAHT